MGGIVKPKEWCKWLDDERLTEFLVGKTIGRVRVQQGENEGIINLYILCTDRSEMWLESEVDGLRLTLVDGQGVGR